MRIAILSLTLLIGCDESAPEEAEPSPPPEASSTTEPAANEAAEPTGAYDIETTEGFIQAEVDGAMVRAEHLPADGNQVTTRMTLLKGSTGPDSEEGFRLTLMGVDVRTAELPTNFERDSAEAAGGSLAAAMRMMAVNYYDSNGHMYTHVMRGDDLECQSFEEGILRCTFEGDANGSDDEVDGQSVEIRNGSLEVRLSSSAVTDGMIEGTAGTSINSAQMAVDRNKTR